MRISFEEIQIRYRMLDGVLDIYLPGTNSVGDVLLYFSFFKKRHHIAGRVHRKFYSEYMKHRRNIIDTTNKAIIDWKPESIRLRGYSLGGLWAKLIAVDLANLFDLPLSVENKGDPMCGNKAFAEMFNLRIENVKRLKYGGDIVTCLPLFYCQEKGQVHIGPKRKWWNIIKIFKDHVGY